jgi:hypothetical protein
VNDQRTLTISLCLNLALAGVAAGVLKQSVSRGPDKPLAATPATKAASAETISPAIAGSLAPATVVANRFGWCQVEAGDFEALARNLRAIGCPEKTARDVVAARARRELKQLSASAGPKPPFWTAGLRRAQVQRQGEREVAAARAKLLARVERALGRDVFAEEATVLEKEDLVEQAIVRFVTGPMSEETFSRLARLFARQEAQQQVVRGRANGVWLEEDEAALKSLGQQFSAELAAALLPAELEEFAARRGIMNRMDKVRFDATDLSRDEIRQIALLRARFGDPAMESWFDGDSMTDEQEEALRAAERQLLGEEHFAQLERAGDGDFKTLFDLGRDHNLPRAAAVQAFELRQLAAQEVARLREDKSLSEAERWQRLSQAQTQTQDAVLKVIGAEACAQYLSRGGAWLTNLSGL